LFLRLGLTAFGGPAAHIALIEAEVVRRRNWLTQEQFLDLLGVTNLIPGPNSTELAIHIGRERAGWTGLLVAGAAFILPAALLSAGFAWMYVRFGTLPQLAAALYGVKPVILAIVAQAFIGLTPKAAKNSWLAALGVLTLFAVWLGVAELWCLFGCGLLSVLARRKQAGGALLPAFMPSAPVALGTAGALAVPFSLSGLFLVFSKIGAVLFGSGYVLLAFLRSELVQNRHWLSEGQLLDAVAVGQITPGPVFTTATFIGYVLGGGRGALLATVGIFLPAFCFVALSALVMPRLRRSQDLSAFLDGVNVASLALLAAVTIELCRAALVDLASVALALISGALLLRFKLNSTWLISGGAVIGIVLHGLR